MCNLGFDDAFDGIAAFVSWREWSGSIGGNHQGGTHVVHVVCVEGSPSGLAVWFVAVVSCSCWM